MAMKEDHNYAMGSLLMGIIRLATSESSSSAWKHNLQLWVSYDAQATLKTASGKGPSYGRVKTVLRTGRGKRTCGPTILTHNENRRCCRQTPECSCCGKLHAGGK